MNRRRIPITFPILLVWSVSGAFAQVGVEAPAAPSASPGPLDPQPSPGPGGPEEPAAAVVAPTAEQAAQPEEADTKVLAKILGLDETPVTVYGWIQNSFTGNPGIDPRNRSTVTVFPNRLTNSWQGNQYYFVIENPVLIPSGGMIRLFSDTGRRDSRTRQARIATVPMSAAPKEAIGSSTTDCCLS